MAGMRSQEGLPQAIGAFAIAGLMLALGLFTTLSRGGFAGFLASTLTLFALAIGRDMPPRKGVEYSGLCFLPRVVRALLPDAGDLDRADFHAQFRRARYALGGGFGRDREFPLVGCGLGGFESAFLKFKSAEGLFLIDYVHNDYLRYLAELGISVFLLAATFMVIVVKRSVEIALDGSGLRWLGLACFGSLAAILVHSVVDFNLYVPANAAVLAWICGLVAGLRPSSPRIVSRRTAGFAEAAVADE